MLCLNKCSLQKSFRRKHQNFTVVAFCFGIRVVFFVFTCLFYALPSRSNIIVYRVLRVSFGFSPPTSSNTCAKRGSFYRPDVFSRQNGWIVFSTTTTLSVRPPF